MAAVKQVELDLSAIQRPPSGKQIGDGTCKYRGNGAFKYRGTLFNSASCKPPESVCSARDMQFKGQEQPLNAFSKNLHNSAKRMPFQSNVEADVNKIKPRRIQSAKGRLERPINYISSHSSLSSMDELGECFHKRKPSVLDLNCVTEVPDKEEELINAAIQKMNMKVTSEFHAKSAMRPSSAKDTFGHPSSKVEDLSQTKQSIIKPSVYGLRLGRQVCGGDSEILEAWNNVDKEYPYKLSEEDSGKTCAQLALVSRQIPRTLEPLQKWMRRKTSEKVIGISPDKCLVFLSHDYDDDELPEVPPPQKTDDPLPFKSVVVTPRKEVPKKYSHPFFENHTFNTDWECSHTGVYNNGSHDDISYLHNPPIRRNSSAIRIEITELENLLQGMGSLNSNCSFVQFQEEILKAKLMSRQLMGLRPSVAEEEPADTFGLLKFYKEHDEMMKVLRERRDQCLQELQLLEQG